MMGQQSRTDSLFYYLRLEDQIPDDHLLKRLDRFIDFGFVRERLRDTYSAMGRPSIDPVMNSFKSSSASTRRSLISSTTMRPDGKFWEKNESNSSENAA